MSTQQVIEELKNNPSLEELEKKFPEVDRWSLRRIRRDYYANLPTDHVTQDRLLSGQMVELPRAAQEAIKAGFFRPIIVNVNEVPTAKPRFKKAGYEVLVISDLHAPKHDPDALDVILQISQSVKIDEMVINGDGLDVQALAKYPPAAGRPMRWVEERVDAVKPFALIRGTHPKLPITYIPGNHDHRVGKFMASVAPQLQGLFPTEQILGLDSFGFKWHDGALLFADNRLMIKHGTSVKGAAGYTVTGEVSKAGMSVIMGHTHRRSLVEVTHAVQRIRGEAPLVGVELGCLCDLRADYVAAEDVANWQQGAAMVTIYDDYDFDVELIKIFNGKAHFRGMRFESRLKKG